MFENITNNVTTCINFTIKLKLAFDTLKLVTSIPFHFKPVNTTEKRYIMYKRWNKQKECHLMTHNATITTRTLTTVTLKRKQIFLFEVISNLRPRAPESDPRHRVI